MKEAVIHEWWKSKNIDFRHIFEQENNIQILDFGTYNATENGPDFSNAKVKIGSLIWCGTVEIHVKSSDWNKHGHQYDANYDNVILHVVLEKDMEVFNSKNELIKTIEIVPFTKVDKKINKRILCADFLEDVNRLTIIRELENSLIDRLNRKTQEIQHVNKIYRFDYRAVFELLLFRAFGNKVNSQGFEQLYVVIYPYLRKVNPFQLKILLYQISGFELSDEWKSEWTFLQAKFNLKPTTPINWKTKGFFAKSHPNIRLNQLIACYELLKNTAIFELKPKDWVAIKKEINSHKILSSQQVDLLLINAVSLFYWWLFTVSHDEKFREYSLDILLLLPAEKNTIITEWQKAGFQAENAFDSQALLELKNQKCNFTKCLECKIGKSIL